MFNAFYPNAAHYQFSTNDDGELYDIFVTILSVASDLADVEIYCPQTAIFNNRKQLSIQGKLSTCINSYLQNYLQEQGFDCEFYPVDNNANANNK